MKRILLFIVSAATMLLICSLAPAASFNYHGTLQDAGKAADGQYDLQLTLYSAAQGGQVIGGPLVVYKVPVHNGAFSTSVDFGPVQKPAGASWLAVQVRKSGDAQFAALDARVAVNVAETAATTGSVCPGAWTLDGNAGNPSGSYLGTADNNPLVFEVNGLQAGTLIPTPASIHFGYTNTPITNAPNVVLGASGNSVGTTAGATISGGGSSNTLCGSGSNLPCFNTATAEFSTVSGGFHNAASGNESTVGGGGENIATEETSTISGGVFNTAGLSSTVGGGVANTASAELSTVGGGGGNTATGTDSTISGGEANSAGGDYSTVSGGSYNEADGDYSFAAGSYANVRSSDTGTFVWSDSTATSSAPFTSTGANQFLISATGGVGIGTADIGTDGVTQAALTIQGFNTTRGTAMFCSPKGPNCSHIHYGSNGDWFIRSAQSAGTVALQDAGGSVTVGNLYSPITPAILLVGGNAAKPGGGSWAILSDRRLKQNIVDIDHPLDRILALHGVEFEYIPGSHTLEAPGQQIGFIAQDVEKVFPDWVGTGSDGYQFVAVKGFEALTVEAMRQLREEKDAEIAALHDQVDQLAARIERLEAVKGE